MAECIVLLVRITQKSAAEAGAMRTCEPRRYGLSFHYEKIVFLRDYETEERAMSLEELAPLLVETGSPQQFRI